MWQEILVYSIGFIVLWTILRKTIQKISLIRRKEQCTGCPSCKACQQKKIYNLDNKVTKEQTKFLVVKTEKKSQG